MTIAENLKRLRGKAGLSQKKLAALSGVSQQLISQIERGENNTTKNLPQLAKALGCAVYDIDPDFIDGREHISDILLKVKSIVDAGDEAELQLLDSHLDFLMSRRSVKPADSTEEN